MSEKGNHPHRDDLRRDFLEALHNRYTIWDLE